MDPEKKPLALRVAQEKIVYGLLDARVPFFDQDRSEFEHAQQIFLVPLILAWNLEDNISGCTQCVKNILHGHHVLVRGMRFYDLPHAFEHELDILLSAALENPEFLISQKAF